MRGGLTAAGGLLIGLVVCGCGSGHAPPPVVSAATPAAVAATAAHDHESYRDGDDEAVLAFGRPAPEPDRGRITRLVERYYADAKSADGPAACALTSRDFAQTIPYDYAQELGPALPKGAARYLRNAGTCAQALSRLFEHSRVVLSGRVAVTGVRTRGGFGYALVGSATMPASFVEVARIRGAWRVDGLLWRAVP